MKALTTIILSVIMPVIILMDALQGCSVAGDSDKDLFFKCLDSYPNNANVCMDAELKRRQFNVVVTWLNEYVATHPKSAKPEKGDLETLCTNPPKAKRFKIGYVLDKTSVAKVEKSKYRIRLSAITSERTSVFTAIVDCEGKKLSYGCVQAYDHNVTRLINKSAECESGTFGEFSEPKGDMKEVVRVFCQRHGRK